MRLKGSEIIALWQKAKKAVDDIHGNPGGEIGDGIRLRGYDMRYDGCSCASFGEKKLKLSYGASCCDHPWRAYESVMMNGNGSVLIKYIDPEKEYEIEEYRSVAELFAVGEKKFDMFVVRFDSNKKLENIGAFKDFGSADSFAKKRCQDEIDRLNRDSTWRRHTPSGVRNDEQRARELNELRHYEYYSYDGYHYWVSIVGNNEND